MFRLSAALSGLIALAACQPTTAMPPSPPPAPAGFQPVLFPSGDATRTRERSSTRQSVDADGTLRTETRSSSVSVDGNALASVLLGLAGASAVPAAPAVTRSQMAGAWRVQQPNGQQCQVILRDFEFQGRYYLNAAGCSTPVLARANDWTLTGRSLRITAPDGQVANLIVQAPTRAEGSGFIMWR